MSKEKLDKQDLILNNLKTHRMEKGRFWSVQDRISYISEQGDNLNAGSDPYGKKVNSDIINTLLLDLSPKEEGFIINALMDIELQQIKSKNANPGTFLRAEGLPKMAAEKQLRDKLEQNPEMADEYLKDPIAFTKNYDIPENLKAKYKEVYNSTKQYAKDNGKKFNPAENIHKLSFTTISGPILKHLQEKSKDPRIREEKRQEFKEKHQKGMLQASMKLTDSNAINTGKYSDMSRSMVTRRQNPITKEVSEQVNDAYDNIGTKLGVIQRGDINMDRKLNGNRQDCMKKMEPFKQEVEQTRRSNLTGFQKFKEDAGKFIKNGWETVKAKLGFGDDPDQVTIKVDVPKQDAPQDVNPTVPTVPTGPSRQDSGVSDLVQQGKIVIGQHREKQEQQASKASGPDLALPEEHTAGGPSGPTPQGGGHGDH